MQTLATESGNSLLAERGGMILLEGQVVDAILDLVLSSTGATWNAFTGASSYQISISGGAFSSTGISGTTYTGTILPGQLVIVQALDSGGNVIAQGTAIISAGNASAFLLLLS